ncbi:MAG: hypothetical protein M3Y78_15195 [Pseudomonadota bacterium]|nr:hypothetical protein [Pseudomonadota bacterium]
MFRFIIIIAGYGMAALAASAFLNVVMLAWFGLTPEETRLVATGSFFFSIPFVALFVAYFAFIPSAFAIVIGEVAGKRDWLFYALAGAVVALFVLGFSRSGEGTAFAEIADLNFALALIGAGMCGGIGYWAVAGRSAGAWRAGRDITLPEP